MNFFLTLSFLLSFNFSAFAQTVRGDCANDDIVGNSKQVLALVFESPSQERDRAISDCVRKRIDPNSGYMLHALSTAVFHNDIDGIRLLADSGVPVTGLHDYNMSGGTPMTREVALLNTANIFPNETPDNASKKIAVIRFLMSLGANPNESDYSGNPINAAAESCNPDFMRFYMDLGVNPAVKDYYNRTPLNLAAQRCVLNQANGGLRFFPELQRRTAEVAWLQFAAHVDINNRDQENNTAVNDFIWNGHLQAAQLLIEAGADLNVVNMAGCTCLNATMMAARWGNSCADVIRLQNELIAKGARPGTACPVQFRKLDPISCRDRFL